MEVYVMDPQRAIELESEYLERLETDTVEEFLGWFDSLPIEEQEFIGRYAEEVVSPQEPVTA